MCKKQDEKLTGHSVGTCDLEGMVAVITGASSGIGRAVAVELAKSGAFVYCVARRKVELEKTLEEIRWHKGRGTVVSMDVTVKEDMQYLSEMVKKEHEHAHFWMNNAGKNTVLGEFWNNESNEWWEEVKVNLYSAYLGTRYAVSCMDGGQVGRIVNVSGGGSHQAIPYISAYAAAKTGIVRFSENAAAELSMAGKKILVFSLNPGLVRTPHTELMATSEEGNRFFPSIAKSLNSGNILDPSIIANAVLHIAIGKMDSWNGRLLYTPECLEESDCMKERGMLRVL